MRKGISKYSEIVTKEFLIKKHLKEGLTIDKIASLVPCSASAIDVAIKKFKIKPRNKKEASTSQVKGKISKALKGKRLKYEDLCTKEFLIEKYQKEGLTLDQIGKIKNIDSTIVGNYLIMFGIPRRSLGPPKGIILGPHSKERRLKMSLAKRREKHFNWRGGISSLAENVRNSFEYNNWRIFCLDRDHHRCQECSTLEDENMSLEVDHQPKPFAIFFQEFLELYNEYSPIEDQEKLLEFARVYQPFWDTNNGQTLCKVCHSKRLKETYRAIKLYRKQHKEKTILQ